MTQPTEARKPTGPMSAERLAAIQARCDSAEFWLAVDASQVIEARADLTDTLAEIARLRVESSLQRGRIRMAEIDLVDNRDEIRRLRAELAARNEAVYQAINHLASSEWPDELQCCSLCAIGAALAALKAVQPQRIAATSGKLLRLGKKEAKEEQA